MGRKDCIFVFLYNHCRSENFVRLLTCIRLQFLTSDWKLCIHFYFFNKCYVSAADIVRLGICISLHDFQLSVLYSHHLLIYSWFYNSLMLDGSPL
jgi:hypothetical protein